MAKPKKGLNYYTVDTDRYQDIRILRLKKYCGCQGLAVYDYILCEIYRVEGSVLEWDENRAFHVADYLGLKESQVNEIVKYCASVGLFDKALLCRGIVTSASIQQRYYDMCSRAKRQSIVIPKEHLLIIIPEECEIIPEECEIIPEECEITKEVCPKVKKSKVIIEKDKEKNPIGVKKKEKEKDAAKAATLSRKDKFYQSLIPYLKLYDKALIRDFFDYWSELNPSQTQMRYEQQKTWELSRRLATWAKREKDFKPRSIYQERKEQEAIAARNEREELQSKHEAEWEERNRNKVSREEYQALLARAKAGDEEAKKILRI